MLSSFGMRYSRRIVAAAARDRLDSIGQAASQRTVSKGRTTSTATTDPAGSVVKSHAGITLPAEFLVWPPQATVLRDAIRRAGYEAR